MFLEYRRTIEPPSTLTQFNHLMITLSLILAFLKHDFIYSRFNPLQAIRFVESIVSKRLYPGLISVSHLASHATTGLLKQKCHVV